MCAAGQSALLGLSQISGFPLAPDDRFLAKQLASTRSADKKVRLEGKLEVTKTHIERAEWLLKELR